MRALKSQRKVANQLSFFFEGDSNQLSNGEYWFGPLILTDPNENQTNPWAGKKTNRCSPYTLALLLPARSCRGQQPSTTAAGLPPGSSAQSRLGFPEGTGPSRSSTGTRAQEHCHRQSLRIGARSNYEAIRNRVRSSGVCCFIPWLILAVCFFSALSCACLS